MLCFLKTWLWDFKKETFQVKKSYADGIVELDLVSPLVTHGDVEKVQNQHDIDIDTPADDVKQEVQGK